MNNEIERCPKCGAPLIEKDGKYGKILACPNWRKSCEGFTKRLVQEKKVLVKNIKDYSTFKPSGEQLNIKEAFLTTNRNIIVRATAGSGKTSTAAWLTTFMNPNLDIVFMSYTTKSAEDIYTKVPEFITTGTCNKIGLTSWKFNGKKITVNKDKTSDYLELYFQNDLSKFKSDPEFWARLNSHKKSIVSLISHCKSDLLSPDDEEDLKFLCDKYEIDYDLRDEKWLFQTVSYIFWQCFETRNVEIDLDDQVFLVAIGDIEPKQWDIVIVDEAQDSNAMMMEFFRRILKPNGRIICIGDENQSIYGFRGSDIYAMRKMEALYNCLPLPLSISWRGSKAIVAFINEEFPGIKHFAANNAVEGLVNRNLKYELFESTVKDGDGVMCRNNAPLVFPCLELIKHGRKANIAGKNIGTELSNAIKIIIGKYHCQTVDDLFEGIENWKTEETIKAAKRRDADKAVERIEDKAETLLALISGDEIFTLDDIFARISSIFSDNCSGVIFTTIHKAKGLEFPNSFVLREDLMPSKMAKTDEDKQQEENMRFVAHSRGKINHYIVTGLETRK
jgi:DNA helicase II / ATP-dependent DNA helicase PcrA